jgi:acyl carrier protein
VIAYETVLADVIEIIESISGDWELEEEIREDSWVLRDLGMESIDAVALGTEIAEKYGRELPFARFLVAHLEQDPGDFTVGQLVAFMTRELNAHGR